MFQIIFAAFWTVLGNFFKRVLNKIDFFRVEMDAHGLDFWLNAVVILGLSILGIIGKY